MTTGQPPRDQLDDLTTTASSINSSWIQGSRPTNWRSSSSSENIDSNETFDSSAAAFVSIPYYCLSYDFVIEAVLMGAFCLLGFVGNSISMVCLSRDSSKTATPFLLVSLEAADTMFLVTVVLLRVLTSIDIISSTEFQLWVQSAVPYLAKYVYPTAMVAQTASIYVTLLVTTNRYVAVCWPYRVADWCSLRYTRRLVVTVLLFATAFNVPRFFEYEIEHINSVPSSQLSVSSPAASIFAPTISHGDLIATTVPAASPPLDVTWSTLTHNKSLQAASSTEESSASADYDNDNCCSKVSVKYSEMAMSALYRTLYSNVLYLIVFFVVPLLSLTFLNQRLASELRRTRRKRARLRGATATLCTFTAARQNSVSVTTSSTSSPSRRLDRSEDDITWTLIVVVTVFVVTQLPAAITQIAASVLDPSAAKCPSFYFFYSRISDFLVVVNSSVNFLIYCLCSRRFRRTLLAAFCRRRQQETAASAAAATLVDVGHTTSVASPAVRLEVVNNYSCL